MIYELYRETNITYKDDKLISMYFDDYTFTGGAHGTTVRSLQTWDLEYIAPYSSDWSEFVIKI